MRIVSWNMGCAGWKYRATHGDAWCYLLDTLKPDIALVQEVMLAPPSWVLDRGRVLLRAAYGRLDWGSGIFLQGDAVPEDAALRGSHISAAEVTTADGEALFLASVHVSTRNSQQQYLRELVAYFSRALQGRRFIVAGDFNAARHWDVIRKTNTYCWFFDELGRVGWHDCHWNLHHREVPTCWPTRGTRYQTDHAFVDLKSASRVLSCAVDQDVDRALSDHAPLVLDLAAPGVNG